MYNFFKLKFMPCHIFHKYDKMVEYQCPLCTGRMVWYGHDGLVCIKCGFVGQGPMISGQLAVV